MDYTRIIHDFVDGSLESGNEERLFIALSSNEELRSELKQQLAIKDAIKGDTKAFTPSAESTMKLFTAIGFTPPPTIAPQPSGWGIKTKLADFAHKYSQGLVAGIISTAMTTAVILSVFSPYGFLHKYIIGDSSSRKIVAEQQVVPEQKQIQEVPIVQSTELEERLAALEQWRNRAVTSSGNSGNMYDKSKYPTINFFANKLNGSHFSASNPDMQQYNKLLSLLNKDATGENQPRIIDFNSERIVLNPASNLSNNNFFNSSYKGSKKGFSFEYRGSQYWFLPDATINPSEYAKFNNTAIALFYSLNNEFSVGLDYRRENFYQSFLGDSAGIPVRIEQQPNFQSLGLAIRYTPDYLSYGNFNTIAQFTAGGSGSQPFNYTGLTGRFMLGGTYSPIPDVSFIIGIEYSGLFFKHQNEFLKNFAKKMGLNYGIAFSF